MKQAAFLIGLSIVAVIHPFSGQGVGGFKAARPAAGAKTDLAMARLRRRIDIIDASTLAQISTDLTGRITRGQTVLTSDDYQTTLLLVHRWYLGQSEQGAHAP